MPAGRRLSQTQSRAWIAAGNDENSWPIPRAANESLAMFADRGARRRGTQKLITELLTVPDVEETVTAITTIPAAADSPSCATSVPPSLSRLLGSFPRLPPHLPVHHLPPHSALFVGASFSPLQISLPVQRSRHPSVSLRRSHHHTLHCDSFPSARCVCTWSHSPPSLFYTLSLPPALPLLPPSLSPHALPFPHRVLFPPALPPPLSPPHGVISSPRVCMVRPWSVIAVLTAL